MSDEIYINTGTTIQQPFNQRNPAQGTTPTTAQRTAQQPAIAQQPGTYSNRSPFTYRHPANGQQPYIANAQQPYPYIANAQNPYPANAQQPYPYIANSQSPYSYNQPSTYSRQGTSVTNVTYTETLTAQDTLFYSGHGDNHIRFDVANVSSRSFEVISGHVNFKITISTSGSNTIFNMDVQTSNYFGDGYDGYVGVSGSPSSVSLPTNGTFRDVFQYSFPTSTAPTTFGYEETDAPYFTKFPNQSFHSVQHTWKAGVGTTYTLSEGTTNSTVSNGTYAFGSEFYHSRTYNGSTGASGYGEGSLAFDLKFNRSGFPELSSEEIHILSTFENEYSGSGGGGPL